MSTPAANTRRSKLLRLCAGATLVLVGELCVAAALFARTDGWSALWSLRVRFTDTRHSFADVFVLIAVKAILVVVCGAAAAWFGRLPEAGDESAHGGAAHQRADDDTVVVQPLLLGGTNGGSNGGAASGGAAAAGTNGNRDKLGFDAKQRANVRRQGLIAAVFFFSTAFQMFVGIKTIQFAFADALRQALMLGALIAGTNLSTWLVVRAAREATADDGYFVPEFHPHPLFYRPEVPFRKCDLCNERGSTFYSCRKCGFDVCPRCYHKKDKKTSEGLLRSDSGYKEPPEFSTYQYIVNTARLVKPHVPLFVVAVTCLVATTLTQLFLPNYQGKILDSIVQGDTEAFRSAIMVYLVLSVGTGLLNAVRSLCFNVAMRQIGMSLRKSLFSQIISQDMIFFDSIKTGDLISRLSGNIGSMLSPLQNTLQTLLSNLILLVGSLVMCFVISWRLSFLAFTTLAPILYITAAYARWSRRQNYMIWQTLGDANADAAEAFTNMRLVRAFSTEEIERAKYGEKCDLSLRKGMLDALYGTLTVTLGDYLDQGASVIILWCGGATAMQPDSALSVGRLITYTLYYNKIQSSYNALNGVLNSFTRSAGAAMRVLSLFDLTPDIPSTDPSKGEALPPGAREGCAVRFENVDFHYQLRPERKVLDGFSLDVPAGTVTALVGRSGAGKSTCASLLLRFYDVKGGRIVVDGRDVRSLSVRSLHSAMGVVTQDTQLFNSSIEDNIAYGLEVRSSLREPIAHPTARRAAPRQGRAHRAVRSTRVRAAAAAAAVCNAPHRTALPGG